MSNKNIRGGVMKVTGKGNTFTSKFSQLPTTTYYFSSQFGAIVYYDDQGKYTKNKHSIRLHNDIQQALAGVNSGYFNGLTVGQRENGDYYVEANSEYKVIPQEQIDRLIGEQNKEEIF